MIPLMGIIFMGRTTLFTLNTFTRIVLDLRSWRKTTVFAANEWHCHETLSAQAHLLGPTPLMP